MKSFPLGEEVTITVDGEDYSGCVSKTPTDVKEGLYDDLSLIHILHTYGALPAYIYPTVTYKTCIIVNGHSALNNKVGTILDKQCTSVQ